MKNQVARYKNQTRRTQHPRHKDLLRRIFTECPTRLARVKCGFRRAPLGCQALPERAHVQPAQVRSLEYTYACALSGASCTCAPEAVESPFNSLACVGDVLVWCECVVCVICMLPPCTPKKVCFSCWLVYAYTRNT